MSNTIGIQDEEINEIACQAIHVFYTATTTREKIHFQRTRLSIILPMSSIYATTHCFVLFSKRNRIPSRKRSGTKSEILIGKGLSIVTDHPCTMANYGERKENCRFSGLAE